MTRPLYPESTATRAAKLENRVDALERRRGAAGFYQIKVFADDETVEVGDNAFVFAIPYDLDRSKLLYVNAYITTVSSSGLVTVQIRNKTQAFDMLTTPVTIDAGELDAENAATPWVIDAQYEDEYPWPDSDNTVFYRQQIAIDVDTAGTGAMGLGVMLGFD